MANPHPDETSTQNLKRIVRRIGETTAEQIARVGETAAQAGREAVQLGANLVHRNAEPTNRMGETAAEAGQEIARASADLLRQNAETLQNAWRFGLDVTRAVMGRSTDQLSRTRGLTGDEAQQATEGLARNVVTILQSSGVLTQGMQGISREYFEFVRRHVENSMKCMNELWLCRTPQDLTAVQTDFVRDTMKAVLDASRRMADMSLKLTDGAANHIAQNMRRAA